MSDAQHEPTPDATPPAEATPPVGDPAAPAPGLDPSGGLPTGLGADPAPPAGVVGAADDPVERARAAVEDVKATEKIDQAALLAATSALAAQAAQAGPPPSVGVRVLGALCLLAFAGLAVFFGRHAYASDLGTDNARLRWFVRLAVVALPAYPAALGAWCLAKGQRPPARWNALALPFEPWWWSTLWVMSWREVRSFLARPLAYILLFFWMATFGLLFQALLQYYAGPESGGQDFQVAPTYFLTGYMYPWFVLGLLCPAATMRLLAEERAQGTLEMLLTAPVTHAQVVLSKYIGVMAFFTAMCLFLGAYVAVMRQYAAEWDWGPLFTTYLGLTLGAGLFFAIGLFTSSVTENQVVAYVLALLPILLLLFVSFLDYAVESTLVKDVVRHVNHMRLQEGLAKGVVQWKTLVFYVSSIVFFLFLAVRGVESHTWR